MSRDAIGQKSFDDEFTGYRYEVEVANDLSGWAPGAEQSFLPDGIGRKLPKGADVVLQVHYHPTG